MSWRRTALPPFQIKSSRPERCLFKANRYVTGDIISRHETLTTSALVHEHFRRQSVSRVACFRPYTAASGERMRNLLRRRVAGRIFADFTGSGSKKKPISYATSSVLPSDMWYRRTGAPRPKLTITHSWYRCYNILHTDGRPQKTSPYIQIFVQIIRQQEMARNTKTNIPFCEFVGVNG